MTSFTFTIPGSPVSKERPRFSGGRAYTPAKTKAQEELVLLCFRSELARQGLKVSPVFDKSLRLEVVFVLGDRRRRDLDNMVKLVQDAINKHAYADDWQIHEMVAMKIYGGKAEARTVVTLSETSWHGDR